MGTNGESIPGGESIPDEEWDRFLRDAGRVSDSVPKEPSARARQVSRRLREEPGPPDSWRAPLPVRRRSRKGWYALAVLLAVALVAVAVGPGRMGGLFGDDDDSAARPRSSARPSAEVADARLPTLAHPFRGSPAERWEAGTDGIAMPVARATGWMSQQQVAHALDRSLDFLVASSLDSRVLRGERPAGAIAQINHKQRDMRAYLSAAFRAPDEDNNPLLMFSRFRASEVRPAGDVVKTRGRVTYQEAEAGAVEVTTDVTYVYPVVRSAPGSDQVARTIVRREVVMSWDDPKKITTEPGTFSVTSYRVDTTNGGCGAHTGYFEPEFGAGRAEGDPAHGRAVDPYDRSMSMNQRMKDAGDAGCGVATRS